MVAVPMVAVPVVAHLFACGPNMFVAHRIAQISFVRRTS